MPSSFSAIVECLIGFHLYNDYEIWAVLALKLVHGTLSWDLSVRSIKKNMHKTSVYIYEQKYVHQKLNQSKPLTGSEFFLNDPLCYVM